jgi:hypothetical protein
MSRGREATVLVPWVHPKKKLPTYMLGKTYTRVASGRNICTGSARVCWSLEQISK